MSQVVVVVVVGVAIVEEASEGKNGAGQRQQMTTNRIPCQESIILSNLKKEESHKHGWREKMLRDASAAAAADGDLFLAKRNEWKKTAANSNKEMTIIHLAPNEKPLFSLSLSARVGILMASSGDAAAAESFSDKQHVLFVAERRREEIH